MARLEPCRKRASFIPGVHRGHSNYGLPGGLLNVVFHAFKLNVFRFGVLAVVLAIALTTASNAEQATHRAGFDERVLTDSSRSRTIPIALWYPTATSESLLSYSRAQPGHVARTAPFAPGRWPLVILSHGSGGNRFNQSALGEILARNGFIVAALEHPGDRTFDSGDSGTARNLLNRPQDVHFVLDALLGEDSAFAAAIDGERIGMIGHSAGGFTAVVVGGGRPNLGSLEAYCRYNKATDPDTCPADQGHLHDNSIEHVYLQGGLSLSDPRVRAAILMASAIGPLFDAPALADVSIPVLLFWAGRDEILTEPFNSRYYAKGLARVRNRAFSEIGHFTFLNECTAFLVAAAPEICRDPPDVDRADVLSEIAGETIEFLRQILGD